MVKATTIGLAWSLVGAVFAAAYLIPYKIAAESIGPQGLVLPMLVVAALLNSLFGFSKRRFAKISQPDETRRALFRLPSKRTAVVALALAAASALGNEAVCQALVWISPGLTSVTLRTQVLFVALGGVLFLREAVGARFWIGVVLAVGGFLLLQNGLDWAEVAFSGIAWALLAAAGFGSMQLVVRHNITRIDPIAVNGLRLWLAAGLIALLPGRLEILLVLDHRAWMLASAAALFGPVVSRLCLMQALRSLPAAHATLALFGSPVIAYLFAGLTFGTWPGLLEVVGSGVILVGVALPLVDLMRNDLGRS